MKEGAPRRGEAWLYVCGVCLLVGCSSLGSSCLLKTQCSCNATSAAAAAAAVLPFPFSFSHSLSALPHSYALTLSRVLSSHSLLSHIHHYNSLPPNRLKKRKEFEDLVRRVGRWNLTVWAKVRWMWWGVYRGEGVGCGWVLRC